ncbi:Zn-dependent protease with chaperone function [Flavobacterium sp. 103]|uniref:M48 family metallopeptidase n=1 Tax=Flavobacterium sp. 103 TaxID=2135624 RepID=UPI000D5FAB4A|nr:M48 family metallopeptidase [Flavobacterium sp. 103]PVX46508.1 Zn-dependent protease with chaperone function [Flavobacterium sp. 103]
MKKVKLSLIIILSIICTQLQAQAPTRDRQKEEKIEKQLEAIDPSLVQIFKEATVAMDKQNYKLADSLYSIVYSKAPNFDPVLRRHGSLQSSLGNTKEGIDLCKKAVEINRSAYNLTSLAEGYLISKDTTKLYEAQQLFKEATKLPNGEDVDILAGYVQISLQVNDITTAKEVVEKLKAKYPNEMLTHYYSSIMLAYGEQWREAKKEILKAQEKGLPQEEVDRILNLGINNEILKMNAVIYFGVIVAVWAFGLLLLFLVGKFFSNVTLKAIENNQLETSSVKPGGWLRSGYKTLINVGGFYYYISLPIILVLVIGLTVGIIYLFLLAGTIPIKLVAILVIGAVVTIYNMIRSLLLKVDYTDPGRELKRDEAPNLYNLTDEVAQIMGTRPIEEIRITPLNDLAVYEKGTRREKMNDRGKRILILGTAVLKDFKKGDFKAVLAHEYGHFTHRDTAGGEVAFRVQNDITKYFIALHNAQQNTIWNVAFHFLRLYNFIFQRISCGATRLQEVLADRVAAETFGTPSFVNGLTHVIKRQIEFGKYANVEIEEAVELKRPINNLYELKGNQDATIEEELNKLLNSKTTEDDTHPSPSDRFRYIDGIKAANILEDESLVKDLFQDWSGLTDEMTKTIEARIDRN